MLAPLVLLASGADAQAAPKPRVWTEWTIVPLMEPGRVLALNKGDDLFKYDLLPPRVARLDDGTKLFGLATDAGFVFCYTGHVRGGVASAFLVGGRYVQQRCLVDREGDGQFKAEFSPGSAVKGVPQINIKLPEKLKPIPPLAYLIEDASALKGEFHVRSVYRGLNMFGAALFELRYGTSTFEGTLSKRDLVKLDVMPKQFQLLGGTFRIEATGDTLSISVVADVPRQPFGVSVRTTYIVY